jgi:hypothetical protein
MRYALIVAGFVFLAFPPAARAGNEGVKFALHAKTSIKGATTLCTTSAPTDIPCSNYVTAAPVGTTTYVYLVAARGDATLGIGGISCGVAYGSNVRVMSWVRCSSLEFASGGWPASGGGNRITWSRTSCQRTLVPGFESQGVHAIAGVFTVYAYAAGELAITPNFNVPGTELAVADCGAAETNLPVTGTTGSVRFTSGGSTQGINPCGGPVPPPPPAGVLLHVSNTVAGNICTSQPGDPTQVVTAAPARADGTARYYVYLLALPVLAGTQRGLSGMEVGIDIQNAGPGAGLRIWSFTTCGYGQTPTQGWPGDDTGNTITWATTDCRRDELVNGGFFYLTAYSPAVLAVSGHPATARVMVADCEGTEVVLDREVPMDRMGWVSFGGAASGPDADGCNPGLESCEQPVPVRPTTWGAIKAMYGSGE